MVKKKRVANYVVGHKQDKGTLCGNVLLQRLVASNPSMLLSLILTPSLSVQAFQPAPTPGFPYNGRVFRGLHLIQHGPIFFTDGSASPPEFPGVRLSSGSVIGCLQLQGQDCEGASGLTPGYVRNIARAETYAFLQAMKMVCRCTLYVDNQGVVTNLQKIFSHGFNTLLWLAHPNFDLWLEIANIIVSHQDASAASNSQLAWIIRGNDKADSLAKRHLWEFVQGMPDLHDRANQYDHFIRHTPLCSSMLQEISHMVLQARTDKEKEPDDDPRRDGDVPKHDDGVNYSSREIALSNIPSSSTWDPRWLDVVACYFLIFEVAQSRTCVPTSCFHAGAYAYCLIAFQIRPPVNMRLFTRRHLLPAGVDVSQYTTQFSRHGASLFPPVMLTDASYIWLRTFDYLQPLLDLTAYPCASLYALGNFGFCNS